MPKIKRDAARARRKRIENAMGKWRYQLMRLVAEFYTARKAAIEKITAELNGKYDPPEKECWKKEEAARKALKKLQEKDCPCLPHIGTRYCEVCDWSLDR